MKQNHVTRRAFALSSIALAMLALAPFSAITAAEQAILKPDGKPADQTKKVNVFILMGQSNMVGMGDIQGGGTGWRLALKKPVMSVYEGAWSAAADYDKMTPVYYDARTKKGSALGALSNNGASIGPELGFGFVMGQLLDEPVLVLKSCIGNRGLGWDLLPPGSKRFMEDGKVYAGYREKPPVWEADPAKGVDTPPPPFVDKNGKPIEWHAGLQYDLDLADAKAALAGLAQIYPDYRRQGYEIAGFVWWQGHKDQGEVYAKHYENNLANLIKSLRNDYEAPAAKFVLATGCGNPGRESFGLRIAEGQLAMNDAQKHPEFAGNVKCVDSRDFWRAAAVSPKDQGFHYNRNAETYMEVGLSLGQAMADLFRK